MGVRSKLELVYFFFFLQSLRVDLGRTESECVWSALCEICPPKINKNIMLEKENSLKKYHVQFKLLYVGTQENHL